MSQNIIGANPFAYTGVTSINPPEYLGNQPRDPNSNDWKGYIVGTFWRNKLTSAVWWLVKIYGPNATWVLLSSGGGVGPIVSVVGGHDITVTTTAQVVTVSLNNTITLGDVAPANDLLTLVSSTADANPARILFLKNRNSFPVTPGDGIGSLRFEGYDGTGYTLSALISSIVDTTGTVAAGQVPGNLSFWTSPPSTPSAPIQRMIIDTNGGVTINNPSGSEPTLFLVSSNAEAITVLNAIAGVGDNGARIRLQRQNGAGGAVVNTDALYNILGEGFDGTNMLNCTNIRSVVDGVVGVNNVPASIEFRTGNGSTPVPSQRVNISSAGNFSINAPDSGFALNSISTFGATVGGSGIAVYVDNAGAFGTVVSSKRFKENIKDIASRSDEIYKLRPVSFNLKKDSTKTKQFGLIAEEVGLVLPELISHDGDGDIMSVKYNELIPLLLNEITKLKDRIEVLESK